MFERALCASQALEPATSAASRSSRWTPCASSVRSSRPCGGSEPLHRVHVDRVLGGVDVQADAEVGCDLDAGGERLVGERERRVRADEAAGERRFAPLEAREEAPVLGEPGERDVRPVAVGRLVAEDAAQPEAAERVGDHVERAVDRVRRGVVVDHRGRPGEQRLHRRRRAPRRGRRPGRAPGRAATRSAAAPAGSPAAARAGTACRARAPSRDACARRRCRARPRSRSSRARRAGARSALAEIRPSVDPERAPGDRHRVERLDDGGAGERDRHVATCSRWPTRWGTAARAAGESFIGSSRAADPVERVERRRRRCGGRDERGLADALRAERPLGLRLLDHHDLDVGHAGGRDDVERLERLRDGEPVRDDELLRQRLAEPHVHGALDLPLEQGRVDRPADVVGGDHLLDPALGVEQHDLRRPAVGQVRDRLGRVVRGRPVDQDLAEELAALRARRSCAPRVRRGACAPRRRRRCRRARSRARRSSGRSRARARCRRARGSGRPVHRAPRRRSGAGRCARPGPSRSRSGRA